MIAQTFSTRAVPQRHRAPDQLDRAVGEGQLGRDQRCGAPYPFGVLVCVVVAILGRDRKPLQSLQPRLFERLSSLADPSLEYLALVLKRLLGLLLDRDVARRAGS